MKRSEMLKMIEDFMEQNNEDHILTKQDAAEMFLNFVESKGMLPPPTETDVVTDYLVYCYYPKVSEDDTDQIDIANSQLWEPEDD